MIVVTRCQILKLKCTTFDFSWGSAPNPAGGAYSAPPDPLAGFKGEGRANQRGEGPLYIFSRIYAHGCCSNAKDRKKINGHVYEQANQ